MGHAGGGGRGLPTEGTLTLTVNTMARWDASEREYGTGRGGGFTASIVYQTLSNKLSLIAIPFICAACIDQMEDLCAMPDSVKLMDDEGRASFLRSDFPAILHHCLLVKDASASLADHIGCVLQSAMPLLVRVMLEAGPDPLPPSLSQVRFCTAPPFLRKSDRR